MASSKQTNFSSNSQSPFYTIENLSGPKERRNRADSSSLVSMEKGFNSSSASQPTSNEQYHYDQSTVPSSSGAFNETSSKILLQVLFPLLVAGLGMVAAGLLLDHSQDTPVFVHVKEIFILVPALLGLKGNLEMTMASRLSSLANMGLLKSRFQRIEVFKANIALTQVRTF